MSSGVFRLYFFYQHGCGHCAAAEPALLTFVSRHPEGMVIRKNLARSKPVAGFEPIGTPAYLMVCGENTGDGSTHVGALNAEQLEKMLVRASKQNEDDATSDDKGSDEEE